MLSRKWDSGGVTNETKGPTAGLKLSLHRLERGIGNYTIPKEGDTFVSPRNSSSDSSSSSGGSHCWLAVCLAVAGITVYAAASGISSKSISYQAMGYVGRPPEGKVTREDTAGIVEHTHDALHSGSKNPALRIAPASSLLLKDSLPHPSNSEPLESMPPSIRRLQRVALPATWRLLHEFFSKPAQIKLHVHDLEQAAALILKQTGKTKSSRNAANIWGTSCGKKLLNANSSFGDRRRMADAHGSFGYSREFGAEVLLAESIRNSAFYVSSPEAADFVFVAACIMARGTAGQYQANILKDLENDPVISSRFKEDRRSIVLTLTADHGPCYNRKERRGGNIARKDENPTARWISPGLWGATMLTHEGSLVGLGCYDRNWASTIPTAAASVSLAALTCNDPNAEATIQVHHNNGHAERSNLVFFSGKKSAGVRKEIVKVIEGQKLSVYHSQLRFNYPAYICAMRNSVFCFAPRGNAVWSPRLEEALAAGCIPIIAADGYDPPYNRILDYRTFTVRLRKKDIAKTADVIAAISEEKRDEMRKNGAAALAVFRYSAGSTPALKPGEDAAPLLAFQLWLRANDRLEELGDSSTWNREMNYTAVSKLH